jgi:hypothetical protein
VEADDLPTTTGTDGAIGTGPETATTTAGAKTVRATTAGTETETETTDGTARAPGTEVTAAGLVHPAANAVTTDAMTGRGTGGGTTIGRSSPSGSAGTGA